MTMDVNRELEQILDALDHGDIELTLVGSIAGALYHGHGTLRSFDVLVARDDIERAVSALGAMHYAPVSREIPTHAGTYRLRRLVKVEEGAALHVNLIAAASPVTEALLVDDTVSEWRGRRVRLCTPAALRQEVHATYGSPACRDALYALSLTFPDHDTWEEKDSFAKFERLARTPAAATREDYDALLTGWRRWGAHGGHDEILKMADELPPALIDAEPGLRAYLTAARTRARCIFRYTLAGFEWA